MPKDFLLSIPQKRHLLLITLIWITTALVINPYGEFPFNDDWAYARSVKALVETQTFFWSAWTSVNLLAQIMWGTLFCLPFGFSFTALRISTLVAGLIGLWGTYRLLGAATENRSAAFMGTLLLTVNPLFMGLSASFMTDVPFYALMVWSLAFMSIGLKRNAVRYMLVGLGLAVAALLVRQFAIALFAGFGIAYVASRGISVKSLGVAVVSVLAGLGTQMLYQRWLTHMVPSVVSYNVQATNFFHLSFYTWKLAHDFLFNTFITLMYVGGFLFPYFLWLISRNSLADFRKTGWLWLLITGVIIGLWYIFFDFAIMPLWFNVLSAFGIGPMLVRDLYYHIYQLPVSGFLYFLLICVTVCSVAGSVGILFYLVRIIGYLIRRPAHTGRWPVAVLLLAVGCIYYFPIGMHIVFDRYLLPIPVLLICLIGLSRPPAPTRGDAVVRAWPVYAATGLIIICLIISTGAVHDYLAWNRVRWQALRGLMKQGVQPSDIDGGLEFNGWYLYNPAYVTSPDKSWWWVQNDAYMVGASVLPGYRHFQQHPVDTWFPWGIQTIFIGKKN